MPELIYFTIASLDGYIEDERGQFGWAAPDEKVHAFVNDLIRPVGTFLYGRRMYETMVAWESVRDGPPVIRDFADIWRNAAKVVFSRTVASVSSERTRIVRQLGRDSVRTLLAGGPGPATLGGTEIASAALSAGLVDEYHLLIAPYVAGSGEAAVAEPARPPVTPPSSGSFFESGPRTGF